ncbi:MAG: hypothetical protein O7G13_03080 [Alphaproteobacteria bacterium]|nr:hypothetical protein [Alphaproteobacteria bacterium]MCZ6844266.1 hypothetical protein [Alphaproteobacteria bacterium]
MPNTTKSHVDGLKCQAAPYIKWDSKVPEFGVDVYSKKIQNKCTKNFMLRYSNAVGKHRGMILGIYGPMTPTRERAGQLFVAIRESVDPLADKKIGG